MESLCHRGRSEDVFVQDVFDQFLAAAWDAWLAVFEGVGFEFLEADLAALDLLAEFPAPAAVAGGDELVEDFVLDEPRGGLQAAGKGVHAADVGVEEVLGVGGLAADLGVEVQAACGEAPGLDDQVHGEGGVVEVGGELVGVPAQEQVAAVGVHGAEEVVCDGVGEFVVEGVAGEGGVVGFEVEFEVNDLGFFAKGIWITWFITVETSEGTKEIHTSGFPVSKNKKFELPQRDYLTLNNLPWGLVIEADKMYITKERFTFLKSFPEFKPWIESNGNKYKKWFEKPDKEYIQ